MSQTLQPRSRSACPGPRVETLEGRRLLAAAWSANAKSIEQDQALSHFPKLNGAGQTIAVIDTGIDYRHPALGGKFGPGQKVVGGWDFVDNDADPRDTYGHGTHVAGVLAANEFRRGSTRYRGIAPAAKLVALRIDEANDPVPDSRIEKALRWVINNRAKFGITVANISFGYGSYDKPDTSPIFGDELKALRKAGVFVVASSGNNGVSDPAGIQYPAADPNVFSVGSVNRSGRISEFTERGPTLDLLAPGERIVTLDATEGSNRNDFATVSGTSFSAPIVAGAIALMRQADPGLTAADVRSILRASGRTTRDGDDERGYTTDLTFVRLNLDAALSLTLRRKPGTLSQIGGQQPNGNNNDLVYDADGVLHWVYYDTGARTLKHVTRSAAGRWSKPFYVDRATSRLGEHVSIAVDPFGRLGVAYHDGTNADLRYAHYDGERWLATKIDTAGETGQFPSLVFDNSGRAAVSYYYKSRGDLRLARQNASGKWSLRRIDGLSDDVGRSTSLAVDGKGRLGVAYENVRTGQLRFANEKTTGGSWAVATIDRNPLGVSWTSLVFDKSSRPAIAYHDTRRADLRFARNASGKWATETVASAGAVGLHTSLTIGRDGKYNLFYYDAAKNQAMRTRGSFGNWSTSRLRTGGGRFISAVTAPTGKLTYTWLEEKTKLLRISDV